MLLLAALMTPAFAGYPLPRMSAIQEDRGARLTITLYDSGDPGPSDPLTLIRLEGTDVTTVFEGKIFEGGGITSTGRDCYVADEDAERDCDADPTGCDDCDDDGVPECAGVCVPWGRYSALDDCVEAGEVDYQLIDVQEGEPVSNASVELTGGQLCGADDTAGDSGLDDGGKGCSAVPVTPLAGLPLTLLALARRRG